MASFIIKIVLNTKSSVFSDTIVVKDPSVFDLYISPILYATSELGYIFAWLVTPRPLDFYQHINEKWHRPKVSLFQQSGTFCMCSKDYNNTWHSNSQSITDN
eukprot:403353729